MNSGLRKFMIIGGIITAAWVLIMATILQTFAEGLYGVLSTLGGIVAFAAASVSISYWEQGQKKSPDLMEINAVGYIFTSAYLAAAFVVNTVLCVAGVGHLFSGMIPIAVNLILLTVLVAVSAFLPHYRNRVARMTNYAAEKIQPSVQASARLSELIALSDNDAVKDALRKLKEQADYSSNVSNSYTDNFERSFNSVLSEIRDKIQDRDSEEEIMQSVREADKLLKTRNSVGASVR